MVGVEALIVDIDGLHELSQIVPLVGITTKRSFAGWAVLVFDEPSLETLAVEDVIAVGHAAHRGVRDRLRADTAMAD